MEEDYHIYSLLTTAGNLSAPSNVSLSLDNKYEQEPPPPGR